MRHQTLPEQISFLEDKARQEKDPDIKKLHLETLRRLYDREFPDVNGGGNGNMDHNPNTLAIFISHSSADVNIAEALVELLQIALTISDYKIRCTSLDGFMLDGGANVDETLRQEILEAQSFIGLITPDSLVSTYVLFELGARWGANRHLIPLLVTAADKGLLQYPLKGRSALCCDSPAQLHQLIANLGSTLKLKPGGVAAYGKYVTSLVNRAKKAKRARKP